MVMALLYVPYIEYSVQRAPAGYWYELKTQHISVRSAHNDYIDTF